VTSIGVSPGRPADAYINLSNGPYPEANMLTTGGAQPWYNSPSVDKFFGGKAPDATQQASFAQTVLQDVSQTFKQSGLNPSLTIDPNVHAYHTVSVVSGTSYGGNASGIGITDVGNNGFGFIDKLDSASSLTDLEWAVAHNVSHELMHAFGVAAHHDQTGQYLDAATATWPMLTNPGTTFSDAAVQDIRQYNYSPNGAAASTGAQVLDGDLEILATPVPEPATVALWGLAAAAFGYGRLRSRRRTAR
jgi:hypothetical protein